MFTNIFERLYTVTISRLILIAFVTMFTIIGGCGEDDNPIIDDHDHEGEGSPLHADADGFLLKIDEKQVYRQFQGEHEGGITLPVGDEVEVHVTFLSPHEEEFHPGEDDDHDHEDSDAEETFGLGLTGYDAAIIDIHLSDEHADSDHADEDHGEEESKWSFEVIGLSAGETGIKLQLLHGDHADFTGALLIPVTVE